MYCSEVEVYMADVWTSGSAFQRISDRTPQNWTKTLQLPTNFTMSDSAQAAGKRKRASEYPCSYVVLFFPLGGANVATLRLSDFFEDLFETMPKP